MGETAVERLRAVGLPTLTTRLAHGGVWLATALVLAMVMLGHSTLESPWLVGWRIAAAVLLLGALGVTVRSLGDDAALAARRGRVEYAIFLLATAALCWVVVRSATPGLGFDAVRGPVLFAVFGLLLVVALVPGYRRFRRPQWLVAASFALLAMIFVSHTLAVHPADPASRWPLWAAIVAAGCLLVIPQGVPAAAIHWVTAGLAALATIVGLYAVRAGEYTVWGAEVGIWSEPRGLLAWTGLPVIQSVFPNINILGLVAFAGLVSAVVLAHRCAADGRPVHALAPGALALVTALGLAASHSRASWLAAAVALGLYAGYVGFGRPYLAQVTVAGAILVVVAMVAVMVGLFPIVSDWYVVFWQSSLQGRVHLWRASLEAVSAAPSAFGEGHIATDRHIEPFLVDRATGSPHNSYLSILIRTGVVGLLAYLGVVFGAIAAGVARRETVDLGMLALACGWAVHMLFEEYTIFQWTPAAVLATLALGSAAFGWPSERPSE